MYTQEGLSPCHLKKAKLMFFYARYPSSNTLKTYFPDVKVRARRHVMDVSNQRLESSLTKSRPLLFPSLLSSLTGV